MTQLSTRWVTRSQFHVCMQMKYPQRRIFLKRRRLILSNKPVILILILWVYLLISRAFDRSLGFVVIKLSSNITQLKLAWYHALQAGAFMRHFSFNGWVLQIKLPPPTIRRRGTRFLLFLTVAHENERTIPRSEKCLCEACDFKFLDQY